MAWKNLNRCFGGSLGDLTSPASLTTASHWEEYSHYHEPPFQPSSKSSVWDIPDLDSDESMIFKLLLKQFNGRTKLGTLKSHRGDVFKGLSYAEAAAWLRRSNRFLIFEKEGKVKAVSINFKEARMCFKYTKRNTDKCERPHCLFFHICRDFVAGNCKRRLDCPFNHSFHSQSNARVCREAGLQDFSDEDIRTIVFRSTPVVCSAFNAKSCNDDCPDLHVCSKFIRNECFEMDCKFGHSIRGTPHNDWVLDTFHMRRIHENTLRRMVILPISSAHGNDFSKYTQPAPLEEAARKGARAKQQQNKTTALSKSRSMDSLDTDKSSVPPTHQPQASSKQGDERKRARELKMLQEGQAVSEALLHRVKMKMCPHLMIWQGLEVPTEQQLVRYETSVAVVGGQGAKRSTVEVNIIEQKELSDSHYTYLCEQYTWTGACSRGYTCPRYHHRDQPPYIWQLKISDSWHSLDLKSDNVDIEEHFCGQADGGKFEVVLDNVGGLRVTLDYNAMTATTVDPLLRVTRPQVRRWSTPSYVEADLDTSVSLYTQWCWYRRVGGKFEPFRPVELQYTLEEKYVQGQQKYYLEIEEKRYMLLLQEMAMVDLDNNRPQAVLRRPCLPLVDHGAEIPHMSNLLLNEPPLVPFSILPDHWGSVDHFQDFEMVEMVSSSPEFQQVERSFHSTLTRDRVHILKIFRVQNPSLWDKFCSNKRSMVPRSRSSEYVDERKLFHGTPTRKAASGICANNVDHRLAGDNVGAIYGKGAYFSTTARYSHSYTAGPERYMFLARVLVGKFTKGDPSYKTPPVREGLKRYDSCVNDMENPTIFVIFDLTQCYPEYFIQYEDVERVSSSADQEPMNAMTGPAHRFSKPLASLQTSTPAVLPQPATLAHSSPEYSTRRQATGVVSGGTAKAPQQTEGSGQSTDVQVLRTTSFPPRPVSPVPDQSRQMSQGSYTKARDQRLEDTNLDLIHRHTGAPSQTQCRSRRTTGLQELEERHTAFVEKSGTSEAKPSSSLSRPGAASRTNSPPLTVPLSTVETEVSESVASGQGSSAPFSKALGPFSKAADTQSTARSRCISSQLQYPSRTGTGLGNLRADLVKVSDVSAAGAEYGLSTALTKSQRPRFDQDFDSALSRPMPKPGDTSSQPQYLSKSRASRGDETTEKTGSDLSRSPGKAIAASGHGVSKPMASTHTAAPPSSVSTTASASCTPGERSTRSISKALDRYLKAAAGLSDQQ